MQAIRSTRPGGHVGYVGVSHDVELPGDELFFSHVHLHGGPAPVRRFLPELIDLIWNRHDRPRQGLRPHPAARPGRRGLPGHGRAPRHQDPAASLSLPARSHRGTPSPSIRPLKAPASNFAGDVYAIFRGYEPLPMTVSVVRCRPGLPWRGAELWHGLASCSWARPAEVSTFARWRSSRARKLASRFVGTPAARHCCPAGRSRISLMARWRGRLRMKAMISATSSAVTSALS